MAQAQKRPSRFPEFGQDRNLSGSGRQTLILNSARIFHAQPEQFISMAQECGLRPVTHFKYERLDKSGKIIESPFRYNYIFVR